MSISPHLKFLCSNFFLDQNEIHSDLMSGPLVRVCIRINFSLNISETTKPKGLIFLQLCILGGPLKICTYGCGIQNNFRTGSEKLPKIA
jgi:hypothetical protein